MNISSAEPMISKYIGHKNLQKKNNMNRNFVVPSFFLHISYLRIILHVNYTFDNILGEYETLDLFELTM
jgi:hypothetical protein